MRFHCSVSSVCNVDVSYHWSKGSRDHGVRDEMYSGRRSGQRGGVVGGVGVGGPRVGHLRRQVGREGGDGWGHHLDGLGEWGGPAPSTGW